jgi:microcystin-dependent protein
MGTDLEKGTTYSEGDQVNAANLNAHVDNAVIKYTAISSKSLKDPASLGDEILINDAGVLKKITLQQISSLVTIPPGVMNDYAGSTAPTGWLLCYGQAISRVTYSALFTAIGTAFGTGDGSSTFNLPDCRGRVSAGKDNMGGSSADRLTTAAGGLDGDTLGNAGGLETHTLVLAEIAAHFHGYAKPVPVGGTGYASGTVLNISDIGQNTDTRGGGGPHRNVQPTIIFNKIIKT